MARNPLTGIETPNSQASAVDIAAGERQETLKKAQSGSPPPSAAAAPPAGAPLTGRQRARARRQAAGGFDSSAFGGAVGGGWGAQPSAPAAPAATPPPAEQPAAAPFALAEDDGTDGGATESLRFYRERIANQLTAEQGLFSRIVDGAARAIAGGGYNAGGALDTGDDPTMAAASAKLPLPPSVMPPPPQDNSPAAGEQWFLQLQDNVEAATAATRDFVQGHKAFTPETGLQLVEAKDGGYVALFAGGGDANDRASPALPLLFRSRASGVVYDNPPLANLPPGLYQAYGDNNEPMGDVEVEDGRARLFYGAGARGWWAQMSDRVRRSAAGMVLRMGGAAINLYGTLTADGEAGDEAQQETARLAQMAQDFSDEGDLIMKDTYAGELPAPLIGEDGNLQIGATEVADLMGNMFPTYIAGFATATALRGGAAAGLRGQVAAGRISAEKARMAAMATGVGGAVLMNAAQVASHVSFEATQRKIAKGMDAVEAMESSKDAALAGAAVGLFSGYFAYGPWRAPGLRAAATAAPGLTREATQEAFEELAELLIAAGDAGDVVSGRQMAESALAGAIGGGAMGGAADVARGARNFGMKVWHSRGGLEFFMGNQGGGGGGGAQGAAAGRGFVRLQQAAQKWGPGFGGLGMGRVGEFLRNQIVARARIYDKEDARRLYLNERAAAAEAAAAESGRQPAAAKKIGERAREVAEWELAMAQAVRRHGAGSLERGAGDASQQNPLIAAIESGEELPIAQQDGESVTDYYARIVERLAAAEAGARAAVGRKFQEAADEVGKAFMEQGEVAAASPAAAQVVAEAAGVSLDEAKQQQPTPAAARPQKRAAARKTAKKPPAQKPQEAAAPPSPPAPPVAQKTSATQQPPAAATPAAAAPVVRENRTTETPPAQQKAEEQVAPPPAPAAAAPAEVAKVEEKPAAKPAKAAKKAEKPPQKPQTTPKEPTAQEQPAAATAQKPSAVAPPPPAADVSQETPADTPPAAATGFPVAAENEGLAAARARMEAQLEEGRAEEKEAQDILAERRRIDGYVGKDGLESLRHPSGLLVADTDPDGAGKALVAAYNDYARAGNEALEIINAAIKANVAPGKDFDEAMARAAAAKEKLQAAKEKARQKPAAAPPAAQAQAEEGQAAEVFEALPTEEERADVVARFAGKHVFYLARPQDYLHYDADNKEVGWVDDSGMDKALGDIVRAGGGAVVLVRNDDEDNFWKVSRVLAPSSRPPDEFITDENPSGASPPPATPGYGADGSLPVFPAGTRFWVAYQDKPHGTAKFLRKTERNVKGNWWADGPGAALSFDSYEEALAAYRAGQNLIEETRTKSIEYMLGAKIVPTRQGSPTVLEMEKGITPLTDMEVAARAKEAAVEKPQEEAQEAAEGETPGLIPIRVGGGIVFLSEETIRKIAGAAPPPGAEEKRQAAIKKARMQTGGGLENYKPPPEYESAETLAPTLMEHQGYFFTPDGLYMARPITAETSRKTGFMDANSKADEIPPNLDKDFIAVWAKRDIGWQRDNLPWKFHALYIDGGWSMNVERPQRRAREYDLQKNSGGWISKIDEKEMIPLGEAVKLLLNKGGPELIWSSVPSVQKEIEAAGGALPLAAEGEGEAAELARKGGEEGEVIARVGEMLAEWEKGAREIAMLPNNISYGAESYYKRAYGALSGASDYKARMLQARAYYDALLREGFAKEAILLPVDRPRYSLQYLMSVFEVSEGPYEQYLAEYIANMRRYGTGEFAATASGKRPEQTRAAKNASYHEDKVLGYLPAIRKLAEEKGVAPDKIEGVENKALVKVNTGKYPLPDFIPPEVFGRKAGAPVKGLNAAEMMVVVETWERNVVEKKALYDTMLVGVVDAPGRMRAKLRANLEKWPAKIEAMEAALAKTRALVERLQPTGDGADEAAQEEIWDDYRNGAMDEYKTADLDITDIFREITKTPKGFDIFAAALNKALGQPRFSGILDLSHAAARAELTRLYLEKLEAGEVEAPAKAEGESATAGAPPNVVAELRAAAADFGKPAAPDDEAKAREVGVGGVLDLGGEGADSVGRAHIVSLAIDDMEIAPEVYQHRLDTDKQGKVGTLDSVRRFDSGQAGNFMVYKDEDGRRFVVDGHQRWNLARRLGQGKQKVIAFEARAEDGWTPQTAMAYAALTNLAKADDRSKAQAPWEAAQLIKLADTDEAVAAVLAKTDRSGILRVSEQLAAGRKLAALADDVFAAALNPETRPFLRADFVELIPDIAGKNEAWLQKHLLTHLYENAVSENRAAVYTSRQQAQTFLREIAESMRQRAAAQGAQAQADGTIEQAAGQAALFGPVHKNVVEEPLIKAHLFDQVRKLAKADTSLTNVVARKAEAAMDRSLFKPDSWNHGRTERVNIYTRLLQEVAGKTGVSIISQSVRKASPVLYEYAVANKIADVPGVAPIANKAAQAIYDNLFVLLEEKFLEGQRAKLPIKQIIASVEQYLWHGDPPPIDLPGITADIAAKAAPPPAETEGEAAAAPAAGDIFGGNGNDGAAGVLPSVAAEAAAVSPAPPLDKEAAARELERINKELRARARRQHAGGKVENRSPQKQAAAAAEEAAADMFSEDDDDGRRGIKYEGVGEATTRKERRRLVQEAKNLAAQLGQPLPPMVAMFDGVGTLTALRQNEPRAIAAILSSGGPNKQKPPAFDRHPVAERLAEMGVLFAPKMGDAAPAEEGGSGLWLPLTDYLNQRGLVSMEAGEGIFGSFDGVLPWDDWAQERFDPAAATPADENGGGERFVRGEALQQALHGEVPLTNDVDVRGLPVMTKKQREARREFNSRMDLAEATQDALGGAYAVARLLEKEGAAALLSAVEAELRRLKDEAEAGGYDDAAGGADDNLENKTAAQQDADRLVLALEQAGQGQAAEAEQAAAAGEEAQAAQAAQEAQETDMAALPGTNGALGLVFGDSDFMSKAAAEHTAAEGEGGALADYPQWLVVPEAGTLAAAAFRVATWLHWGESFASKDELMKVVGGEGVMPANYGDEGGAGYLDFVYDAMEMAINLQLKNAAQEAATAGRALTMDEVEEITGKFAVTMQLGTQSAYKKRNQQYSTPPEIAFVAAQLTQMGQREYAVEPSAGNGGLAVFLPTSRVAVNDIAPNRLDNLDLLGGGGVVGSAPWLSVSDLQATSIGNLSVGGLPAAFDVVLMNPPFSNDATRGATKDSTTTDRHVRAALETLRAGGRAVVITGENWHDQSPTHAPFFQEIYRRGFVKRASIWIDGKMYNRYGAGYPLRLTVLDKPPPKADAGDVLRGKFDAAGLLPVDAPPDVPVVEGEAARATTPAELAEIAAKVQARNPNGEDSVSPPPDNMRAAEKDNLSIPRRKPPQDFNAVAQPLAPAVAAGREANVEAAQGAATAAEKRQAGGLTGGKGGELVVRQAAATPKPAAAGEVSQAEGGGEATEDERQTPSGRTRARARAAIKAGWAPPLSAAQQPSAAQVAAKAAKVEAQVGAGKPQAADDVELVAGSANPPHPIRMVRAAAMAKTAPPPISVSAGDEVNKNPAYSVLQANFINRAVDVLETRDWLAKPAAGRDVMYRPGILGAQDTGFGKTRVILGLVAAYRARAAAGGRAIIFSAKPKLFPDLQNEAAAVGVDPNSLINYADLPADLRAKPTPEKIAARWGENKTLFVSYTQLRTRLDATLPAITTANHQQEGGLNNALLNFIVQSLAADTDILTILDEAHETGNASSEASSGGKNAEGARNFKNTTSQAGQGVLYLQQRYPAARVVYMTATAMKNPSVFPAYHRLPLVGGGNAVFKDQQQAEQMITAAPVVSELLAQHLRRQGAFDSLLKDSAGVEYQTPEADMTTEQSEMLEYAAWAWARVYRAMMDNLEKIVRDAKAEANLNQDSEASKRRFGSDEAEIKKKVKGDFTREQKRFFKMMYSATIADYIAQHAPDMVAGTSKLYPGKHKILVQTDATFDAEFSRAVDKVVAKTGVQPQDENFAWDEVDMSPLAALVGAIKKSYDVRKREVVRTFEPDGTSGGQREVKSLQEKKRRIAGGEPLAVVIDRDKTSKGEGQTFFVEAKRKRDKTSRMLTDDYELGAPVRAALGVYESLEQIKGKVEGGWPVYHVVEDDPELVRVRDATIADIEQKLRGTVFSTPLDTLLLSAAQNGLRTGEITGRKWRLDTASRQVQEEGGLFYTDSDGGGAHTQQVKEAWARGDLDMLLFSEGAGGTGYNFHSTFADEQTGKPVRVAHFVLSFGEKAEAVVQALGRSNRTGQTTPPLYVLVLLDSVLSRVNLAPIARKLREMMALTTGDGGLGLDMLMKYDIDDSHFTGAISDLAVALQQNAVPGLENVSARELFINQMKLTTEAKAALPSSGGRTSKDLDEKDPDWNKLAVSPRRFINYSVIAQDPSLTENSSNAERVERNKRFRLALYDYLFAQWASRTAAAEAEGRGKTALKMKPSVTRSEIVKRVPLPERNLTLLRTRNLEKRKVGMEVWGDQWRQSEAQNAGEAAKKAGGGKPVYAWSPRWKMSHRRFYGAPVILLPMPRGLLNHRAANGAAWEFGWWALRPDEARWIETGQDGNGKLKRPSPDEFVIGGFSKKALKDMPPEAADFDKFTRGEWDGWMKVAEEGRPVDEMFLTGDGLIEVVRELGEGGSGDAGGQGAGVGVGRDAAEVGGKVFRGVFDYATRGEGVPPESFIAIKLAYSTQPERDLTERFMTKLGGAGGANAAAAASMEPRTAEDIAAALRAGRRGQFAPGILTQWIGREGAADRRLVAYGPRLKMQRSNLKETGLTSEARLAVEGAMTDVMVAYGDAADAALARMAAHIAQDNKAKLLAARQAQNKERQLDAGGGGDALAETKKILEGRVAAQGGDLPVVLDEAGLQEATWFYDMVEREVRLLRELEAAHPDAMDAYRRRRDADEESGFDKWAGIAGDFAFWRKRAGGGAAADIMAMLADIGGYAARRKVGYGGMLSVMDMAEVGEFLRVLDDDLIDGLQFGYVAANTPRQVAGYYSAKQKMVALAADLVRQGENGMLTQAGARTRPATIIHEVLHHVWRFVSPEQKAEIRREMDEALAAELEGEYGEARPWLQKLVQVARKRSAAARFVFTRQEVRNFAVGAGGLTEEQLGEFFAEQDGGGYVLRLGRFYRYLNEEEFFAETLAQRWLQRTQQMRLDNMRAQEARAAAAAAPPPTRFEALLAWVKKLLNNMLAFVAKMRGRRNNSGAMPQYDSVLEEIFYNLRVFGRPTPEPRAMDDGGNYDIGTRISNRLDKVVDNRRRIARQQARGAPANAPFGLRKEGAAPAAAQAAPTGRAAARARRG